MLEIKNLSVAYGKHQALRDVELTVADGEVVVLLGANGAGKSSLLKAVAGLVPAMAASEIQHNGADLRALQPHAIVETGIALVPEGRGIFAQLTVRENLQLGAHARRARSAESENLDQVLRLFPKLAQRLTQVVSTMSGGEQQMVAIGRALMSAPETLLLDEPSLGLSPIMSSELFKALRRVREIGISVLLVEQNAKRSLAIADRGYLIENGAIVGSGPASTLANDPAVQRAYLGLAAAHSADGNGGKQAPIANEFQLDIEKRLSDVVGRDATEMLDGMIALGRHGKPEEIARAVLFLASNDSSFTTGTVLMADGGMHI